ncbi:MAG: hypothetical protein HQL73_03910 [Magnetococcales bacterium]|nr:hypothetical protein [Magnetococcales bacterium]
MMVSEAISIRHWLFLTGLILGLCCTRSGWADPRTQVKEALETFAMAQEQGDQARRVEGFRQAERLFAGLVSELGGHADLYANLGVAALQGGHIGSAILAFRRALLLDPSHQRSRTNLHYARSLLPSWVPRPVEEGRWDRFLSWWHLSSELERQATMAVVFLVAAAAITMAVRFGSMLARYLAIVIMFLWIALVSQKFLVQEGHEEAVIVQEETVARAADSVNAPISFVQPLPAGTEVRILEKREAWVRIALGNGRHVWVRSSAVEMVR